MQHWVCVGYGRDDDEAGQTGQSRQATDDRRQEERRGTASFVSGFLLCECAARLRMRMRMLTRMRMRIRTSVWRNCECECVASSCRQSPCYGGLTLLLLLPLRSASDDVHMSPAIRLCFCVSFRPSARRGIGIGIGLVMAMQPRRDGDGDGDGNASLSSLPSPLLGINRANDATEWRLEGRNKVS